MASSSFKSAEKILEHAIEELREISIMASNFYYPCQNIMETKVQNVITDMARLDALKEDIDKVQIPLELVDIVDSGRNPMLYTKKLIDAISQKKQERREVVKSYSKLKEKIIKELSESDPLLVQQYFTIRKHNRPMESKSSDNSDSGTSDETSSNNEISSDDSEQVSMEGFEEESSESRMENQRNGIRLQENNATNPENYTPRHETLVSNEPNPTLVDDQYQLINNYVTERQQIVEPIQNFNAQLNMEVEAEQELQEDGNFFGVVDNKENINYLNIQRRR